jgi:uncharacterized protein YjiS (DUF1127 family)
MSNLNQLSVQALNDQGVSSPPIPTHASIEPANGSAWGRFMLRVATRHALRELDESALKDVGLTRQQALEEAYRPFWQLFR